MMTSRHRVLVIGLDGATFDLIEPWSAKGHLPHLAQLMASGCVGPLASTLQPVTAPAWSSFMTGVNQGKHGIYDFVRRRQGEYNLEVTNGSQIATPTIFDIASQQRRQVVAVNIPYTSPPRPVNGVMVGGPFAPAVTPDQVYPTEFFHVLKSVAPDYRITPDYDARSSDPLTNYAERLLHGIEMRERLCLHLLQAEPWDLFAVVFMATDEAQHTFWHCHEAPDDSPLARHRHVIRTIYQRLDQVIGNILSQISNDCEHCNTTIIIMSDHGAGPLRWMINLNRWLAETGFLAFRTKGASPLRKLGTTGIMQMAHAYRRYTPAKVRSAIRARMGTRGFDRLKGNVESALLTSSVDWEHTHAYALGAGGNIFINLKGREPDGVVSPGTDYERLRMQVADALMKLPDPETGRPIVRRVHRREDLYNGPLLDQAPDLIIEWVDYAYWGRGRYDSQAPVYQAQSHFEFSAQPLSGAHRPEGIFIASGPDIKGGHQIAGASLIDLAPTIMGLLQMQVPEYLDGHFLQEILLPGLADSLPATLTSALPSPTEPIGYSSQEEDEISEHLRALGYL